MEKTQKQTFLQGAFILIIANVFVKGIGALFKIPLARFILGPDGMGIYNTSYVIYTWLFVIATAGLPIAVSKMVSESIAYNNRAEAYRIFNVAFYLLSAIGMVGTVILFLGAKIFADGLGNSRAYLAMMAMSPSLIFVAITSAYRGYFQGLQNMIPTAISQVCEAVGKLGIGLLLGYWWMSRGIEYASAGAILGVSAGAFLGAMSLYAMYQFSHPNRICEIPMTNRNDSTKRTYSRNKMRNIRQILWELIKVAVPITIGASVFSLTNVIDMAMIMNRLQTIGFSEKEASTLYGYYSGYAITMFNLPPTLIVALGISIVPAIASALAMKHIRAAKRMTESSLRMTMFFSLPCGIGLMLLAEPILTLIFGATGAGAAQLLNILGIAVVFVSLVLVTNSILQAAGRVWMPVKHMMIGGIVKIITNFILVGIPSIYINGAPIGTIMCYLVVAVLNLAAVKKEVHAEYKIGDFIIKPAMSVLLMAIAVSFVYNKCIEITYSNFISTSGAIGAGAIVYILTLFAVGGIKTEDIEMMPKGKNVAGRLNRWHILRQ